MANRVVWWQKSFFGTVDSAEERRWRSVVENPLSASLSTVIQFAQQCSSTPHTINDVVFVGTFATHNDYQVFLKTLASLPNLRRLGIVNAQVMMFQIHPAMLNNATDISIRSCRMNEANLHMLANIVGIQLRSIDLSNNFLRDLSILTNLMIRSQRLAAINISKNHFSEFPQVLSMMTSLVNLNISNNRLTALDANDIRHLVKLQQLDISNNVSITKLPAELYTLPALVRLDLTGLCSLTKPNYELAKKGLEAVRRYLSDKAKKGWLDGKRDETNILTF